MFEFERCAGASQPRNSKQIVEVLLHAGISSCSHRYFIAPNITVYAINFHAL